MGGRRALTASAVFLLATACGGEGSKIESAGSAAASAVGKAASGAVPSLVNVDLRNVLNDLAVKLNLDKANVPINAQIPITLAVNVCGVSINVLAVSTGGQANCTATTSSPELAQVVQQQMAAGGSVGGGAQGDSNAGTSGSTASAPAGTTAPSTGTAPATGTATGTAPATGTASTSGTAPATGTTAPATGTSSTPSTGGTTATPQ